MDNKNSGELFLKRTIRILFSTIVLSILYTLISCGHAKLPIQRISYGNRVSDSFKVKLPIRVNPFIRVVYGADEKSNVYFFNDIENNCIISFNGRGSILDTVPYPFSSKDISHPVPHSLTGFCAITKDSFAFLQYQELFLYGVKSKSLKKFDLYRYGTKYGAFMPVLEIADSFAFFYNYEDTMVINTQKNWELYMKSAHHETVFNLNRGRIEDIKAGEIPIEIYKDSNSYYAFEPMRCLNPAQHELVYLYPQSNLLYVFNYLTKTCRTVSIQNADFTPNEKYDIGQGGDFNYNAKYRIENDRYQSIIYNPFRKEYYILFYPKSKYEIPNSDEVTQEGDKPYSVFVLDSNFTTKTIIDFPAKTKYYYGRIPMQKGVLVGDYSNDTIRYAVFEF